MPRTTPQLNSTLRESILNTRYASQARYGTVKANSTYDEVLALIKGKVEGGYSHPVHWYEEVYIKNGKNTVSSGSGETMYGEDRAAGQTEANSTAGKEFWALVDTWSGLGAYKVYNRTFVSRNWPAKLGMANPNENYLNFIYRNKAKLKYQRHGAEPSDPVLKEKMKSLSRAHVKTMYDKALNSAFDGESRGQELKRIINSDGRLIYLFLRLRFNGPLFYNAAGKDLSNFYTNNPNATVEELIDSSLEWKWKFADGLQDGTGSNQQDSKDLIKRDTLIAAEFFGWPRTPNTSIPSQSNFAPTTPTTGGSGTGAGGGNSQTTDPIAQDKKSGDTEDVTPKQPTGPITQIKRLFKPTIRPIDIELDMKAESLQNKKIIASTIGYTPLIFYNGIDIKATDISSFRLYHEGMLPKIECVISDTYGIFKKTGIPGDDTKISIFINSKSKILASLRMDFKVLEFAEISPGKYRVSAIIDIPRMYMRKYTNFAGKTSLEALQDLARELGLGFCTNITNTNDKQNWINIGKTQRDFMNNITQYSYISDTSFQVCYVDYYYNLCFVDVSREFERDVNGDVGVSCVGFDSITGGDKKSDDKIESLVLTNERNLSLSSGYIDKYKVTNNSTTISLKKAYRNDVKYLDTQKKEILYFTVDSQSGDPSKSLILKASSGDDEFFKENTKSTYGGKLDANTDGSGNAHANSSYTAVNNQRNLTDFAKLNALMYLPNCNLNLYPYRKVKVHIMNPKQTPDDGLISTRLTGDWLISGIEFSLSQGSFRQVLTCLKRELSLTKEEQDSQPINRNQDQSNFKTSPNTDENILPNSVYKVGEIYTVKDAKGLEYKMTVEAVSTDGKEITASVDTRNTIK
jgi:hypothetical protein